MKQQLLEKAKKLGISDIGFCRARRYSELEERLRGKRAPLSYAEIEKRINPEFSMPHAKSAVVCLFSYHTDTPRTNLSCYAKGKDYHIVVGEKLAALSEVLTGLGYTAKCFCDTGALCDRHLAWLAGLGFFGKNHMLISPKFGSYVFIGYILTDAELEIDKPLEMTCAGCGACVRECPGGALDGEDFCAENCASYLTQKKGVLDAHKAQIIRKSGFAWGCDICQIVCPHNKGVPITGIDEFRENLETELKKDMAKSNREFRRIYAERAFSWRGYDVILRNLSILQEGEKVFSGAIFDVDGTILDSMQCWENMTKRFLAEHGIGDISEITDNLRNCTLEMSLPLLADACGLDRELVRSEFTQMAQDEYAYHIQAKDKAVLYMETLHKHGVKIAIATSGFPDACKMALERLGVMPYITAFAFSGEVGVDKSHPDIYLLAAKRIGVEPKDCMVFEDILAGIRGAKKAGMLTTAVKDDSNLCETEQMKSEADRYITNWGELL